jgi:hypothetical protein
LAQTGKLAILHLLLGLAAQFGWSIRQIDVRAAFLSGDLDEIIYMRQPPGLEDGQDRVWLLKKAIYEQAARAWHSAFSGFMNKHRFSTLYAGPGTFVCNSAA